MTIGVLSEVWRYPVKSMQGSMLRSAWVDESGVLGDRMFALRDMKAGTVASAKHPRKWPDLLRCEAEYVVSPEPGRPPPGVAIVLPTGVMVQRGGPRADAELSEFFGLAVSLQSRPKGELLRETDRTPVDRDADGEVVQIESMGLGSPPGRYYDYGPIHILTTATLRTLAMHRPKASFDRVRFRPNLVIDVEGIGFAENEWLGHRLRVGEVLLEIFDPTPRCVVTTLPQRGLDRDRSVLRTVVAQNSATSHTLAPGQVLKGVAGVYGRVVTPGVISVGDEVGIQAWDT